MLFSEILLKYPLHKDLSCVPYGIYFNIEANVDNLKFISFITMQ
jgi:hypothetical protein